MDQGLLEGVRVSGLNGGGDIAASEAKEDGWNVYIVDQLTKQMFWPVTPTVVMRGGRVNCFGLAKGR